MAPVRTCIGCRSTGSPGELVRVARRPDGSLVVGRGHPGRGAWLCRDSPTCVEQAVKRRAFERALRGPVAGVEVEQLRTSLHGEPSVQSGRADRPTEGSEGSVL